MECVDESEPQTSLEAACPPDLVDVADPYVSDRVAKLRAPNVRTIAKKIIYAVVCIVVLVLLGLGLAAIFDANWMFYVCAVLGVLGGILMIVDAFVGRVAPCPYCDHLFGSAASSAGDEALVASPEARALQCGHCGEYATLQNGEVRAHDPRAVADTPTFESSLYKDSRWPRGCLACGSPPTRFDDLCATDVDVAKLLVGALSTYTAHINGIPYCDAHKDGIKLKVYNDTVSLRWRSLAMMRKYRAANRHG